MSEQYALVNRDTNEVAHTQRIYRSLGAARSARTKLFGGWVGPRALRRVRAEDLARIATVTTGNV